MNHCVRTRLMTVATATLVTLAALGAAGDAAAASFAVNPTRLALSGSVTSRVLTVRNDSPQLLRFQLTVMAWGQSASGEMELAPTKDVTVFPPLLSVAAGETRSVRVGLVGKKAGTLELTYRIFVEEMPPVGGLAQPGITMLTRVGVPIFIEPSAPRGAAAIGDFQMAGDRLSFAVRNDGNVHFIPQSLQARIFAADGSLLSETSLSVWYILAGGHRRYDVDLSSIPAAARVSIEMQVNGTRVSGQWSRPDR